MLESEICLVGFYYMTVNSSAENVSAFTCSNESCEGMQNGSCDKCGGRCPTCNAAQRITTVVNKTVIKLSVLYVTVRLLLILL
jgi:hypothetical protein